jgi:hypothetical protein
MGSGTDLLHGGKLFNNKKNYFPIFMFSKMAGKDIGRDDHSKMVKNDQKKRRSDYP